MDKRLIIATRKSRLALWQANHVKTQLLAEHAALTVDLLGMTTAGDQNTAVALADIGGKDLFVKTLQQAILADQAQLAVHSIKDLSVHTPPELQLAAICQREDPRDAFISNDYQSLADLPEAAIVGTSSPRRACQVKALRPDVQIKLLRGNVETRLKKLDDGDYAAIILAAAGLKRLNLANRITAYLDPNLFIPAIGQGAIGIECRRNNDPVIQLLNPLNHTATHTCVRAERAVNQRLKGDCHTPIGAYATLIDPNTLTLIAMVGSPDGQTILRTEQKGSPKDAQAIGEQAAQDLLAQGAQDLLLELPQHIDYNDKDS